MFKIITPAIATLALAVSATPAAAEPSIGAADTRIVKVYYNDLDLTSQAGVTTLEGRIRAAIRNVCGAPVNRELQAAQALKRCREGAQRFANRQLAAVLDEHGSIALATMLTTDGRG